MDSAHAQPLQDGLGRRIRYLRISLTPLCNFRCLYCQPRGPAGQPGDKDSLSPYEIEQFVSLFASLGVEKLRLTGGEPTLREDLPEIVGRLTKINGIGDISLSTHGMMLAPLAQPLATAGLSRVNVSLDSLLPDRFRQITGHDGLGRVLEGLHAARSAGLTPIKLNVVPLRGINDDELGSFLKLAAELGATLRFIELMPVEVTRDLFEERHLSGEETLAALESFGPWDEVEPQSAAGPARRFRRADDGQEIGLINPLAEGFCEGCNRVRLTHDGQLRMCLFGRDNVPLRHLLASPRWRELVTERLREGVRDKPASHRLEQLDGGVLSSLVRIGG